jgi:hypothetical protein
MSLDTFQCALQSAPLAYVNIGGGEPTCHPHFWDIMDMAMDYHRRIWVVTNGKIASSAIRLAKMAERGWVKCGLSLDKWHEPISQDVINAFVLNRHANPKDKRFIQNVGKKFFPIKSGRCDWGNRVVCNADNKPYVKPNGEVRQCGCKDSPVVGDVFGGYAPMRDRDPWACAFGLPSPKCSIGKKRDPFDTGNS